MGLLDFLKSRPAWESDNKEKALRAVEKETEQAALAEIAADAPLVDTRKAAVEKLTDQSLLAEIAKKNSIWMVRKAAVKKLTDQSVLAHIAKRDSEEFVRQTAVEKLTSQSILADIALNAREDKYIREAAIKKLTDQSALIEILQSNVDASCKLKALGLLHDENLMLEFANSTDNCESCILVYGKMNILPPKGSIAEIADIINNSHYSDKTALINYVASNCLQVDYPMFVKVTEDDINALFSDDKADTLEIIAKNNKVDANLRFLSCQKTGGHFFAEGCTCSLCNLQEHMFSLNESGMIVENSPCKRCGEEISYDLITHYTIIGENSVSLTKGKCAAEVIIPKELMCNGVKYTVTDIGYQAFANCLDLESVTIPHTIKTIAADAFLNCCNLETVAIPDSVTKIGNGAFSGCSRLSSIAFPSELQSIGSDVFWRCTNLTGVNIPGSVTDMGTSIFSGCIKLRTVNILSRQIHSIPWRTFYECHSLRVVVLPESVKRLESQAFRNCRCLTSITLPDSLVSIDGDTFKGCDNLAPAFAAELGKRLEALQALKALRIEVIMQHPERVRALQGYDENGALVPVWKWMTSFRAKDSKGGFELKSPTYKIKNGAKVWLPDLNIAKINGIKIGKGGDESITREFHGEELRGGYFERRWSGHDEFGNPVHATETVYLD